MHHDHSPAPVLLTPHETAVLLNTTIEQLRRWRSRNTGPTYHHLGHGLIRYPRGAVENYTTETRRTQ